MATRRKKQTSYDRVKEILNEAAEGSQANYQGYGNFWETLSLKAFEKVKIYGIQMIAPVPESSCDEILDEKPADCCSSHESDAETDQKKEGNLFLMLRPAQPKYKGRGAASGLIKGLKGEFPYDADSFNGKENSDGHFPRLPWGGKEVSEKDIKFISNWIDQGCPENDTNYLDTRSNLGKLKYKVNMEVTDIYKPKLKQRKNIDNLSEDELYRLRCAFYELKKLNAWPRDRRSLYSWGKLHGNVCEHGWEQFLTWHRMFLYEFEQTLQDFDPTVTLPYWDWTDKKYNKGVIPKEKPKDYPKAPISGVIPEAFRCWINKKAIENLKITLKKLGGNWQDIITKLESIIDIKFNSGVELFYMAEIDGPEYYTYSPEIIKQLEQINPLWYPLRYPCMFYELDENGNFILKDGQPIAVGEQGLQQNFHHHFPTAEDVDNILKVDNWRDFAGGPEYNQSFGVLDMAPHNTIHIWLGGYNKNYKEDQDGNPIIGEPKYGDMLTNLTAGFDPIFWPHHVMIDRMFHKWQELHPGQGPFNPNGALAGLGYSVNDALSTERLGYEYVSVGHVFQLANPRGVSVFKSDYINFDASVYAGIKGKVELRLHEVVQPENSFIVRIFLNSPDADMFTPATKENKYYAGSVFFWGHGRCVGGPGHCAPPPAIKRDNDLRPPDHNSRRNYRINITETVKALADEGVTEFQINLVIVGPDGSDHPDEFFPKAISVDVTN